MNWFDILQIAVGILWLCVVLALPIGMFFENPKFGDDEKE